MSNKFKEHLDLCGIEHKLSCPGTPQQNDIAERKHCHIVETCLTRMIHANIALRYKLVHIFLAYIYSINRFPYSIFENVTPYFKLYGNNPNYGGLHIIGCRCFPYLRHQGHNKF